MVSRNAAARGRPAQETTRLGRRAVLAAGAAIVSGAASAVWGCGRTASPAPAAAPARVPLLAQRYVMLALELARHQPSLLEAWPGGDRPHPSARVPAPSLRATAAALRAEAERDLPPLAEAMDTGGPASSPPRRAGTGEPTNAGDARLARARARYLLGQIRALDVAAGRLVGESLRFADEAALAFGHVAPPRDTVALEAVRRELAERLSGSGALAERHAAFRQALAVPRERLERVFESAVTWCLDASRPWMPLPDGATLTTRTADERGWAAFSRPSGPLSSELWIARDGGSDAAQVLQLAAHEGAPGHHAQHVLASARLVEDLGWDERSLIPAFGPHRLLAEGAAEAGAELLLPLDVRERVLAERLLPAAGQRPSLAAALTRIERLVAALDLEVAYVAAEYLDGTMPSAVAADRLRDDALLLDPAGMVSFIEKQRSKVLAYPVGRRLVTAALGDGDAAERWARFAAISTTLTLPAPGE